MNLPAKNMKIDEIIDSLGAPPAQQAFAQTAETLKEITNVYHEIYAVGLSAFFVEPGGFCC